MYFSGGGNQGIFVNNDNALARFGRMHFQAFTQIQFFAGKQFAAESANGSKGLGLTKNEGAGHPVQGAADPIPKSDTAVRPEMIFSIELDRAAAGQALAGLHLLHHGFKQFHAGPGIGVDKYQPIAAGCRGAAIAGAGDLVHRLEHDPRAGLAGDFGCAIGGIIVAHDQFAFPAVFREFG